MSDFQRVLFIGLALALFSPLLVRLALQGVVGWWKKRFIQRLILTRLLLEDVWGRISTAELESQYYSPDDPEPYTATAEELHRALSEDRSSCSVQAQQRSGLLREVPNPPTDTLGPLLLSFWPEPRDWYELHRRAEILLESVRNLQTSGLRARQLLEELRRKPVELSGRIKRLRETDARIVRIAQTLSSAGLHGEAVSSAVESMEQLRARLDSLPTWFHQESEDLILKRSIGETEATKEATILAWATLEEVEEPIRGHLEGFRDWQSRYREVGGMIRSMRNTISTARQHLADVPSSVDVRFLVNEVGQIGSEARQLEERYGSPTIEALDDLSAHAQRITETANRLTKRSDLVKEHFDRLRQIIAPNTDLLAEIIAKMDELARAREYPLHWQTSKARLESFRKVEAAIGRIEMRRSARQLEEHLSIAGELQRQTRALWETIGTVEKQREEIISLLERPELIVGVRLDQVRSLYESVTEYAAENWPEGDVGPTLLAEAKVLARRQKALIPSSSDAPLQEQQIAERLDGLRTLATGIAEFRARLQWIEEILASLRQREREAEGKLRPALQALERLRTASTPLSSLQEEGRTLASDLRQRSTGEVSRKAERVDKWADDCVRVLSTLKRDLQARIDEAEDRLKERVRRLRELASFAQEQAMIEAREMLMVDYAFDVSKASHGQTRIEQLVDLVDELTRREDALNRSTDELASEIEEPIRGCAERLKEIRQKASEKYARLIEVQRRARSSWPPVTCSMGGVERRRERVERYSKQLKNSGTTLAYVLSHVDLLIERYEDLIERIDEKSAEIEHRQQSLQGIQRRVRHWTRSLEAYRLANTQDTAAAKAVQDRLREIEEKLAGVRRDHRRLSLSYGEAKHRLEEVWHIACQPLYIDRGDAVERIGVGDVVEGVSAAVGLPGSRSEFVQQISVFVEKLDGYSHLHPDIPSAQDELRAVVREAQKVRPEASMIRRLMYSAKGLLDAAAETEPRLLPAARLAGELAPRVPAIFGG